MGQCTYEYIWPINQANACASAPPVTGSNFLCRHSDYLLGQCTFTSSRREPGKYWDSVHIPPLGESQAGIGKGQGYPQISGCLTGLQPDNNRF